MTPVDGRQSSFGETQDDSELVVPRHARDDREPGRTVEGSSVDSRRFAYVTAGASQLVVLVVLLTGASGPGLVLNGATLQPPDANLPELTQPVNDFARVIDPSNSEEIDRMIRTLQAATGDVVVVATVPTIEPFGDIREYANRLFENHGRGIGQRDSDNGLLIVLALRERRVQIEVGYGLEAWITDGFAGETSREYMGPAFRDGRYGDGLRLGTARIISRIARGRNVTLDGVRVPAERPERSPNTVPFSFIILAFAILLVLSRIGRGPRRGVRSWGRPGWSGWSSGIGSFGGGWTGRGGGFGGFGRGRSGGGGGAGW